MAAVMQRLFLKKYNLETLIASYCKIKNNTVWMNGKELLKNDPKEDLSVFLSSTYKNINLNYPKFFKMDKQCKLGILAAELILREQGDVEHVAKNEVALVFSNNAASLESDRAHAQAISDKQNYFPSPAVFVYTLPNIVIGEVAIKHKLTGENAFFISEEFDAELMHNYASILLQTKSASSVLCGWVNVDGNSAEAFVYFLKSGNFKQENGAFQKEYSTQNIQHLYSL